MSTKNARRNARKALNVIEKVREKFLTMDENTY